MPLGSSFEAFADLSERIKNNCWGVGHFSAVNIFNTVKLGKVLGDTDSKLSDVIVCCVVDFAVFFEQVGKVVVPWNEACGCFYDIDIVIDAQFSPKNPDHLIEYLVEVFSVFVLKEVVDGENQRRAFEAVSEIEVVLDVCSQRNRQKVEVGH